MRRYVFCRVVLSHNPRPEMNHKIFIVNLKGKNLLSFVFVQFFRQLLFLFLLFQLYLPHVLMLQLLLIRVVDFFFNLIDIDFLFLIFLPIVVLDHHHTLSLIVPCSIRVLIDYCIFAAYKEWFGENSVNHHDEALDCKESRIVFFL